MKKTRIDQIILNEGYANDVKEAQAIVISGVVFVDGVRVDKVGTLVGEYDSLEVKSGGKYVSRGGYKLEKAISAFDINLNDLDCLDIGSSTGGFTDCMLQNGARHVTDVDVGVELAWKLRKNERVTVMERTNVRFCSRESFGKSFDFISCDVSFISLKLVLPVICDVLKDNGRAVCLIKPQFEADRDEVGKGGIVRDKTVHAKVIHSVLDCAENLGLKCTNLTFSPIKGTKGNVEYLAEFNKFGEAIADDLVEKTVSSCEL